jgi:isochorismate hydrolase
MNETTSLIKSYKGKNIRINPVDRPVLEQVWTDTGLGYEAEYRLSAFFQSPLQF